MLLSVAVDAVGQAGVARVQPVGLEVRQRPAPSLEPVIERPTSSRSEELCDDARAHLLIRPEPFGAAGLAAPLKAARRASVLLASVLCLTSAAAAQATGSDSRVPVQYSDLEDSAEVMFKSVADSLEWARARFMASKASGLRVVVSLREVF